VPPYPAVCPAQSLPPPRLRRAGPAGRQHLRDRPGPRRRPIPRPVPSVPPTCPIVTPARAPG